MYTVYDLIILDFLGHDCNENRDGCEGSPCTENRVCTDVPAADEETVGTPYTCGPCPTGYDTVDTACVGKCLTSLFPVFNKLQLDFVESNNLTLNYITVCHKNKLKQFDFFTTNVPPFLLCQTN